MERLRLIDRLFKGIKRASNEEALREAALRAFTEQTTLREEQDNLAAAQIFSKGLAWTDTPRKDRQVAIHEIVAANGSYSHSQRCVQICQVNNGLKVDLAHQGGLGISVMEVTATEDDRLLARYISDQSGNVYIQTYNPETGEFNPKKVHDGPIRLDQSQKAVYHYQNGADTLVMRLDLEISQRGIYPLTPLSTTRLELTKDRTLAREFRVAFSL